MTDAETVFQGRESPEGGYEARAAGYSIFTQGDAWDDLIYMMRDAVLCHFDDGETPQAIRVYLVQNEVIPVRGRPEIYQAWSLLPCCGYNLTQQRGSHIETYQPYMGYSHNVSVPRHNPLRVGALDDILGDVAEYLEIGQDELMRELFGG